jgi:Flp pilus assembly protein TadD
MTVRDHVPAWAFPQLVALALALGALAAAPKPCIAAGLFSHVFAQSSAKAAPDDSQSAAAVSAINQALDERRYVDASALLDEAVVRNPNSPELVLLTGELMLARGHCPEAMAAFRSVEAQSAERARALEGEGICLSLLGRSDESLGDLKQATDLDHTLWRAWDALGVEYDARRDWPHAQAAYAKALAAPGVRTAIVLNNRGYSHLLQRQTDLAAADFVAALEKEPALAEARTNLRLTLGIEGHYARAALAGDGDDRAAVLNNVGVAAALRGDYVSADKMLNEAIAAKGQFYSRASENLQIAHELAARRDAAAADSNAVP